MADDFQVRHLHRLLDRFARRFCPVTEALGVSYHWSLMQVEYATDIVFKRQQDLIPLYETISRTAVHAVKAENVATFLGRKLHVLYEGEAGNDFSTRIQGTDSPPYGTGLDQDVRQIRPGPSHRDHGQ